MESHSKQQRTIDVKGRKFKNKVGELSQKKKNHFPSLCFNLFIYPAAKTKV